MRFPSRLAGVLLATTVAATACSGSGGTDLHRTDLPAGLSGVGTLPAPASAWPEAGGDARFSSPGTASGPQTAHVRWHTQLDGDASPGPVIGTDGGILAGTNSGHLYDLDPKTGKPRWTFDGHGSFGSDLSTSPAVLGNGTILWPGPANTLYALTAQGKPIWKHSFDAQLLSPAIAGHQRVYVADIGGAVSALDVSGSTPRVVWTLSIGSPDFASPSVGQNGTIYTAADHDVVAVRDLGTKGGVLWRLATHDLVEVSNGVAPDGTVVAGSNDHHEYGIGPDGSVRWIIDLMDRPYSSSIIRPDGTGYVGDNSGRVRVFDTKTGTVSRTVVPIGDDNEKVWTSVIADAHGDFYWGSTAGEVYGYGPDGKELFHVAAGSLIDSYPALGADGTLYIGTTAGLLYAFGA